MNALCKNDVMLRSGALAFELFRPLVEFRISVLGGICKEHLVARLKFCTV